MLHSQTKNAFDIQLLPFVLESEAHTFKRAHSHALYSVAIHTLLTYIYCMLYAVQSSVVICNTEIIVHICNTYLAYVVRLREFVLKNWLLIY